MPTVIGPSGQESPAQTSNIKHLDYDSVHKKLSSRKLKVVPEETVQANFYDKLPVRDIADIFRLVNGQCNFLSALTPLQPRYAKKVADDDILMAAIMAQAINLGNHGMSETSDIPYHSLEAAHQQYLRLSTLKSANDRISNFIAGLAIFPHYSLDLEVLYGSVDGQKFESADPTTRRGTRANTSAGARASWRTPFWPTTSRSKPN